MTLEQAQKKFPIGSECYYYSKYGGKLKISVFDIKYNIHNYLMIIAVPPKKSDTYYEYDIYRCIPINRCKKLKRILDIED
jgi:predicted SAM-dependent methyltransferase